MPKFKYSAIGPDGVEVNGVTEAHDRAGVGVALLERDLQVTAIAEKKSILQFEITKKKVAKKDLMHFSRQLAAFLRSGISILDALEVIESEMTSKVFKPVLLEIVADIRSGSTFAGAAHKHPYAFPPVYLGMLESAEMTGNLDSVLDQLSTYLERELEAKRKVKQALMYPGIVAVMSVVTVGILAGFVLPRFKDFFDSLDATLPLPTRMLLATSGFFTDFWYVFPLAIVLGVGGYFLAMRTDKGRETRDRLILRLPVVGDLVRHAILERFCRVLSSMTRAGVPLPEAMLVVAGGMANHVYKTGLMRVRESMLQGRGLAEPIAESGLFPGAARQMIRVGEETGTLDAQLESSARYFEQELDYKVTRFTSMFEPAVIIFMGVVVGFVAIALVSAMYGIFRQVEV